MRKLALCLLLILTLALSASSTDYYTMRDYVTNTYGSALSGVYVYVYAPNTTTPATAYSDLAGSNAVTFPLTTDSNGMFECYIASGNYDVYIVHSAHNIETTWDNYMVGVAAGADSLGVVCVDTLKPCSGDTLFVTTSDGAQDATISARNIMLSNTEDERSGLYFGKPGQSMWPRIYLPTSGVLHIARDPSTVAKVRVPHLDTTTYSNHPGISMGGLTESVQVLEFWEDGHIAFQNATADSADSTGTRYDDRNVLYFRAGDHADSTRSRAYQSLELANTRGDSASWAWGKTQTTSCTGVRNGVWGVTDYGIKLLTDIPDSNGTNGWREAVRIEWDQTDHADNRINHEDSCFLTMTEEGRFHYYFRKGGLELFTPETGESQKFLKFRDYDGGYTRMANSSTTSFGMNVNGALLQVRNSSGGADDAAIDAHQVRSDTLRTRTASDTLYIRSEGAGPSDDVCLDVQRVAADTLKADVLYVRAADGQDDAELDVHDATVTAELKGARVWLSWSADKPNESADSYLAVGGDALSSSTQGPAAMVAGSVKGYSVSYNIDSHTTGAYALTQFYIDGSKAFTDSFYVNANEVYTSYATFARDTEPFSAGDMFSVYFDIDGTLQYDSPIVVLDLQLDE